MQHEKKKSREFWTFLRTRTGYVRHFDLRAMDPNSKMLICKSPTISNSSPIRLDGSLNELAGSNLLLTS